MTNRALLVMDVQNAIVDRIGDGSSAFLSMLGRTVAAARTAGIPVIYVRIGFRPGAPEMSPRNLTFTRIASGAFDESDPATQIHSAVALAPATSS